MSTPYLGQIFAFAGNFAPRGYLLCQGQLLAISQYTALFSILGTTYGGNGTSNFALPNLSGRALVGTGTLPGGGTFVLGEAAGSASVTLTTSNMPAHTHTVTAQAAGGAESSPANAWIAQNGSGRTAIPQFTNTPPSPAVTMAPGMLSTVGSGLPVSVQSPYLAITYIIAIEGIFPSRN